jgi:hypothetical protein
LWKIPPISRAFDAKGAKKLLDAKIIFQVRHSSWVANLVLVKNKSGDISSVWISEI